ncbi:MAG: chemotaxis protein CheW [Campylobacterales bacterium]|nr:chemotaxis protein CheW [Campylobacterales bacterium]
MDIGIENLTHHMPAILEYEASFSHQLDDWSTLDRLARINNTGIDIGKTKEEFKQLSKLLCHNLAQEISKNLMQEIGSVAQVSVDILVRNLFERTADIGFLSTDKDIRQFLANGPLRSPDNLQERFKEYVTKYSVYEDVVLLDTEGNVLVSLDETVVPKHSFDPLLQASLEASGAFVETFRHTDLQPHKEISLAYSCAVLSEQKKPLGVLVLFFKFDDEVQGIFQHLSRSEDWTVLTLLDQDNKVIASSDIWQIPLGVTLEVHKGEGVGVTRFRGRQYLAKTCKTKGYEGYKGLGWMGHAMIPLEYAFLPKLHQLSWEKEGMDLTPIMQTSKLFSEEIKAIPCKASKIQKELDRTVINGKLMDETGTIGMVLGEISRAGVVTKEIFEEAIEKLYKTVISTLLSDAQFSSALAIDIMDRNLYERANDCRWWALAGDFRRILAQESISPKDQALLTSILSYINNLYTVYTNLLLYDAHHKVVAVSASLGTEPWQLDSETWLGKTLEGAWANQTLRLTNTQHYAVSEFEPTPLYKKGEATYIYNAAICPLEGVTKACGGIGIVFDSEPQFRAILNDALPKTAAGEVKEGCFGLLTTRQGRIISSTHPAFAIGETFLVEKRFLEMPNGTSLSGLAQLQEWNYVVGATCSKGYREFKSAHDVYHCDVIALTYVPIGKEEPKSQNTTTKAPALVITIPKELELSRDKTKVITFEIGGEWFGFRAEQCACVLSAEGITPILSKETSYVAGFLTFKEKTLYVVNLSAKMEPSTRKIRDTDEIVVIRIEGNLHLEYIGIVASRIGEVQHIPHALIDPLAGLMGVMDLFSEAVIRNPQSEHAKMVTLLCASKIANRLVDPDRQKIHSIWST